MAYDGRDQVALTLGSFDTPELVKPDHHYGIEGRLAWIDIGESLPGQESEERW